MMKTFLVTDVFVVDSSAVSLHTAGTLTELSSGLTSGRAVGELARGRATNSTTDRDQNTKINQM